MNINKKNIELLLSSYLLNEIKCGKTKHGETYFGELLIELIIHGHDKILNIHFVYYEESSAIIEGKWSEIIEFSLTDKTDQSREYLKKLENEIHVSKNGLYNIIEILKEIC